MAGKACTPWRGYHCYTTIFRIGMLLLSVLRSLIVEKA